MRSLLLSGILAGLAGGIVLGILLTVVMPSTPGLPMVVLMRLLLAAIGSEQWLTGWIIVLGASAVIGVIFAGVLRVRGRDPATVVSTALFIGLGSWLAEQVLVVPLLFDASAVTTLTEPVFWPLVPFVLVANLLFSSVLAAAFLGLHTGKRKRQSQSPASDLRRAA